MADRGPSRSWPAVQLQVQHPLRLGSGFGETIGCRTRGRSSWATGNVSWVCPVRFRKSSKPSDRFICPPGYSPLARTRSRAPRPQGIALQRRQAPSPQAASRAAAPAGRRGARCTPRRTSRAPIAASTSRAIAPSGAPASAPPTQVQPGWLLRSFASTSGPATAGRCRLRCRRGR
jgi:hypothetical protein